MVSVILPTYNRPQRFKTAISSICHQTFKFFEIVVVDNSSNNKVEKIVNHINDSRIIYIKNKAPLDVARSRSIGVKHASFQLISFLDDDDVWNKKKLELQYNCIQENTNVDMVLCDYQINNLISQNITTVSMHLYSENFKKNILLSPGPFLQCILIQKRCLLNMNQMFDSRAIPSEDWDFFINLSKQKILVGHINKPLFVWNFSKQSQSNNLLKESQSIEYIIKKHQNYIKNNSSKKNLSILYRKLAHMHIDNNNIKKSKKIYGIALSWHFLSIKNILFFTLSFFGGYIIIKKYLHKK